MQFSRDGEWYRASRITGPTHNFLALRFGEGAAYGLLVEALNIEGREHRVRSENVERWVQEGLAEANDRFGTHYCVTGIQFVPDDTPSEDAYRLLTKALVEQLVRQS